MTQELELDCLDQLEATPAILRGLMCHLPLQKPQRWASHQIRLVFPPTRELG
jgi:hypothetical protein